MVSATLQVVGGAAAGTEVALDGEFVVGRDEPDRGNLANDEQISRRHAVFRREDDHFVVEDLGSTNGTFLNGQRVSGPMALTTGDEIRLGETIVRFDGDGGRVTEVRTVVRPAAERTRGAAAPPARPAPPAPARPAPPPPAPAPAARKPARSGVWRDALTLLVASGVVVTIWLVWGNGVSASSSCGGDIGRNGAVQFVSYTLSNGTGSGDNSVLATPYGPDMKAQEASQCSTGGSGATQLMMPGVVDGNDQIILNPERTLLFAVNQGSDSIAVFRIQANGGLEAVDGSPFPSNGKAPSSLGLSGNTLVVANKARDGIRELEAESPNYTTFTVASDGKLTPVPGSSILSKPASAPTSAVVPGSGGVAFGLEDGGPIRGFSIDADGVLKQAEGSPYTAPDAAFAPGTPAPKKFALGVRAHPTERLVYITLPLAPALAVFSYDETGKLEFIKSVHTVGAFLPCWIQITKDGRWLYASSAGTNNVVAYDLADPRDPKQIQDLPFEEPGNAWNIKLDPSNKYLFAITPRVVPAVPLGKGNVQHVMRIGADGKLTEVGPPTELPVPDDASPVGLEVVTPKS
jgi:6-phosphogluconolactonase (cycloisomerase 2 family)